MSDLFRFLIKTYWGKTKTAKVFWAFSFKVKTHGVFACECGVWRIPRQNAWAERKSNQNAWGQLHLDCMDYQTEDFQKNEVQNPDENHA